MVIAVGLYSQHISRLHYANICPGRINLIRKPRTQLRLLPIYGQLPPEWRFEPLPHFKSVMQELEVEFTSNALVTISAKHKASRLQGEGTGVVSSTVVAGATVEARFFLFAFGGFLFAARCCKSMDPWPARASRVAPTSCTPASQRSEDVLLLSCSKASKLQMHKPAARTWILLTAS